MNTPTPRPGRYTLLALVLGFALVATLRSNAAPFDVPTSKVDTTPAINQAELRAATAIATGDITAAKGWAEVAFQLRAGQYLAPLGEITAQFTGQIGNLKAFVAAGAEVSSVKPIVDWYDASSKYSIEAFHAVVLSNDPAAFKAALVRSEAWSVLRDTHQNMRNAMADYKLQKEFDPKQSDYLALMNWLEAGANTPTVPGSELMTKVVISQECRDGIAPFRKLLTPQGVVSK